METEQLLQKICERLDYKEGYLVNKSDGKIAGYIDKSTGYYRVSVGNKKYYTHRLIYLLFTGEYPKVVDHKDRNRLNNKIENLRAVTHKENIINSDKVDKAKGVCYMKSSNRWVAYSPRQNGKAIYLGCFKDESEALKERSNYLEKKYGA